MSIKTSIKGIAAVSVLVAAACSDPSSPTPTTEARASRVPRVASPRGRTPDPEYVKLCVFSPHSAYPATTTVNYSVDKGNNGSVDVTGTISIATNTCIDAWTQGTTVSDKVTFDLQKPNPAWVVKNTVYSVFRATPGNPANDVFTNNGVNVGTSASGLSNGRNGATVEFTVTDF